jgi:uncharacterized Zn finger protein (UPF0148 family)
MSNYLCPDCKTDLILSRQGQVSCYYCGKPMLITMDYSVELEPPEPITTAEEKPAENAAVCADCHEVMCECNEKVWSLWKDGYGWRSSRDLDGKEPIHLDTRSHRLKLLQQLKQEMGEEEWKRLSVRRIPKEKT